MADWKQGMREKRASKKRTVGSHEVAGLSMRGMQQSMGHTGQECGPNSSSHSRGPAAPLPPSAQTSLLHQPDSLQAAGPFCDLLQMNHHLERNLCPQLSEQSVWTELPLLRPSVYVEVPDLNVTVFSDGAPKGAKKVERGHRMGS